MSLEVLNVPLSCVYSKESDLVLKTLLIRISDKLFYNSKTGFLLKLRNGVFISLSSFGRDQYEVIYVHESLKFEIETFKDESLLSIDSLAFSVSKADSDSVAAIDELVFNAFKVSSDSVTINESLLFTLTGGLINGSSINGTVI